MTRDSAVIRSLIMGIPVWLVMGIIWLPTIVWHAKRLDDGGGEPLGLLALTIAAAITWRDRNRPAAGSQERIAGALVLCVSVIFIGLLPPMLRAALAILGTGLWCGFRRNPALFGLWFLSLPLAASMHFYLGYPLRLAAAEGAFRLLELGGIVVARHGTNIDIGVARVGVDPDCGGILMLWHTLAAAMALAAYHRASWKAANSTVTFAILLAVPANMFRVAWLAVENSGRVTPTGLSHDHVGLICFLTPLPLLWWWASRHSRTGAEETIASPEASVGRWILALTAALAPWMMVRQAFSETAGMHPLPSPFLMVGGESLFPSDGSCGEIPIHGVFPGAGCSIAAGDKQVILRRVERATRKLHPARDCLRGAGFEIGPSSTLRYPDSSEWTRFSASRNGARWVVHERIVSEQDGSAWTDASAWFWEALAYPLNGPWRAETVISR
jgi:exosortase/archaeosortase family protein